MKNGKTKRTRTDPLDDEVNIRHVRYLDTGKYFKQKAAEHRYVQLEPDVYAQFASTEEINEALRLVINLRNIGGQRQKKSGRPAA
jgi:hypothetical protein